MSHGPADAPITRRDLLKAAGAAGAALAVSATPGHAGDAPVPAELAGSATMMGVPFERHQTVRVAIVGTGLRGRSVLGELLAVDGVQVTALCDIVPEKVARAAKRVTDAGQPAPTLFTDGERDFERLVERDDIDIVYTATPWDWHVPICLAAMKAGKHAATEVPAARPTRPAIQASITARLWK